MTEKPQAHSYLIDWNEGFIHRSKNGLASTKENVATVTFCGDWGPIAEQETALRQDPISFYGNILDCTGMSNLTVINIEFPICTNGQGLSKDGPTLCVEPDLFTTLSGLSCNVACLANNHMMDFGQDGLDMTLQTLRRLGIQTVGAGVNAEEALRPLVQEVNGLRVALVNIAEGEEAKATPTRGGVAPFDISSVCDQISNLSNSVDIVLVVIHAGREYLPVPPPYIQSAYRTIADSGAGLIIAHHPHVPQGFEIWNDVPIFYSLGNFVLMDTMESVDYRNLGYMIQAKINKAGIDSIQVVPYKIGAAGLEILTGATRNRFLTDLKNISALLEPASLNNIWNTYADMWFESRFSLELRQFIHLMSWKELCGAVSDRFRSQAQQIYGVKRFYLRLLGSGFQRLSKWLSSENTKLTKPASVFRNRFDTMAHRELYLTALQRVINGKIQNSSSEWARELLNTWHVFD